MIPKGWKEKIIDDVVLFEGGSQPPKATFISSIQSGYIRLIQIRDYKSDKYATFVPKSLAKKFCKETDIMIGRYGPPLFQIFRGLKGAYNVALIKAVPKSLVERKYLYYFFMQEDIAQYLESLSQRTGGQTGIEMDRLKKYPFPLPPLAEQRKIAEILGTWDEAIATAEQLIGALKRRKQGLMQRLLTGEVRFPEFEGEAWEEVSMDSIVNPVSRVEAVCDGSEYRLIGVRWYLEGAHIHDVVRGSELAIDKLNRIEQNDIFYNKMWVSKAAFAVAKDEHAGAYGTSEYPQFRAKPNLDVKFLEYIFHHSRFLYDAKSLCNGTTGRIRLHPQNFLKLRIKIPSLNEQQKIVEVLQLVDDEIDGYVEYLQGLKSQKKGLMQRLLTGQVRVQVGK